MRIIVRKTKHCERKSEKLNEVQERRSMTRVEMSIDTTEALSKQCIETLKKLLNEIYDTGQISPGISKSIFIAQPKKPGTKECELHRMVNLISHIAKILLGNHHDGNQNKIKAKIAVRLCGGKE